LSKSVGKLVFFRVLGQDLPKAKVMYDKIDEGKIDWEPSETIQIIRPQTQNYEIDGDALETKSFYKGLSPALQKKYIASYAAQGITKDDFVDSVNFVAAKGLLNFNPITPNNPKGLHPAMLAFSNHNFSLQRPLLTTESKQQGFKNSDSESFGFDDEISITPVYNFYLKNYENFYSRKFADLPPSFKSTMNNYGTPLEKAIPNFYFTILAFNDISTKDSLDAANFHSIESFLGGIPNAMLFDLSQKIPQELFSELITDREQNSVIVITSDFLKNYGSLVEKQKKIYPMYNEISIPTVKSGTAFRELFKHFNLYDDLQYTVASVLKVLQVIQHNSEVDFLSYVGDTGFGEWKTVTESTKFLLDALYKKYKIFKLSAEKSDKTLKTSWKETELGVSEFDIGKSNIRSWPTPSPDESLNPVLISNLNPKKPLLESELMAANWIESVANFADPKTMGILDGLELDNLISPMLLFGNQQQNNIFSSAASVAKLKEFFVKLVYLMKLNASEVVNNKENYSEVLFFEVVKYVGIPSGTNPPIQTFLLPNDPELVRANFVDSQIIYGKQYFYQIYAHTISVGNKLHRSKTLALPFGAISDFWDYDNQLDVKLLRVPYYNIPELEGVPASSLGTTNMDAPPMPPNVNFFPFKNISNKIGFWFNVQMGEAFMVPEYSLMSSTQLIDLQFVSFTKHGTAQEGVSDFKVLGKNRKDEPVFYKTDDYGGKFEVYRLTKRPEKYADFKNAKIATVDVIGSKTLIDDIQPNQDYYYIVRAIDVHGLPSNPTPVYHFKMITHGDVQESDSVRIGNAGAQPVLFNELIYLSDNLNKKVVDKSFKKYLLIEPSLNQTFLSFDNFGSTFKSANDVLNPSKQAELNFGNVQEKIFDKKFKLRITSKQTGKKLDVNVHFKQPIFYDEIKES
jgi:hypothetical protein